MHCHYHYHYHYQYHYQYHYHYRCHCSFHHFDEFFMDAILIRSIILMLKTFCIIDIRVNLMIPTVNKNKRKKE